MNLRFPLLDGGQEQGLNDAGVEAFQGSIGQYVVRECAQNSGDAPARPGSVVKVVFELLKWDTDSIPCIDEIRAAVAASRDYWKHDEKTRKFFDRALRELGNKTTTVLRVGDYGTTGLQGGDTERTKGWYALVKSQGVSVKDDTAGGSYGIGKSSPFAASRFRTVFYSTRTQNGDVAFQGVCRLVTHKNSSGNTTQSAGFIGGHVAGSGGADPLFTAIRNEADIPEQFLRSEVGTDIFIPGYFTPDQDWERELIVSVLNNFWPAIHRGTMQFAVGRHQIGRDNLGELIQRFREVQEFEAHYYYGALSSPRSKALTKNLRSVGKCQLFLTTDGDALPKSVCLIRRAGMVIDSYAPHNIRIPYAGLFVCEDPDGNKLLRAMEPPRHDRWDPKRIEGDEGKEALNEIRGWIREKVRELNPTITEDVFNEAELGKWLPEVEEGESTGSGDGADGGEEGLMGMPRQPEPPVDVPVERPLGAERGSGSGDEGRPNPKGGDGKDTGGKVRRSGGGGKKAPLEMRSFSPYGKPDEYVMVLRSSEDFSGGIRVIAAGDDETDADVDLASCHIDEGGPALEVSGNRISEVNLTAGEPLRLRLKLARARRIALILEN